MTKKTIFNLTTTAFAYLALDNIRSKSSLTPAFSEIIQPALWGSLTILALFEAPRYRNWIKEFKEAPKFILSVVFFLCMISFEVIAVHFATVVLGISWHEESNPLPDTGQWLLLAMNEYLPSPVVSILRAHLIELHHYLMLFIMLAFSVLFGHVKPPGLGLASRYLVAMGIGRFLRSLTFLSTILPSPRPWCASHRFRGFPNHPHPWAQKYYVPYAKNQNMIWEVIQRDSAFAPPASYPSEFTPKWGFLQFLVPFLRPPSSNFIKENYSDKFLGVVRPGGGCNDLAFSGHMLVATLTSCAWQEAHPGWGSALLWLLTFHSAQREIRERQHYSVDVIAAMYVGFLLWRATNFLWSFKDDKVGLNNRAVDELEKAAKDGDLELIKEILQQNRNQSDSDLTSNTVKFFGAFIILFCVVLSVLAFVLNIGG